MDALGGSFAVRVAVMKSYARFDTSDLSTPHGGDTADVWNEAKVKQMTHGPPASGGEGRVTRMLNNHHVLLIPSAGQSAECHVMMGCKRLARHGILTSSRIFRTET